MDVARPWRIARVWHKYIGAVRVLVEAEAWTWRARGELRGYGISISGPVDLFYLKSEIGSDADVARPCRTWREALKYLQTSGHLVFI